MVDATAAGEIGVVILLLCLLAQYLYSRAKQWRWRAIVQERERLAHELHDTLAQSFAGVAFQLQGIRNGLEHADSAGIQRANQQIDLACEVVRQTHEEASLSIAMLREEWPAGKELGAALEQCAASIVAGGQYPNRAEGCAQMAARSDTFRDIFRCVLPMRCFTSAGKRS